MKRDHRERRVRVRVRVRARGGPTLFNTLYVERLFLEHLCEAFCVTHLITDAASWKMPERLRKDFALEDQELQFSNLTYVAHGGEARELLTVRGNLTSQLQPDQV